MNLPACKKEMDKFSKGLLYQIVPNKSWSNVCYTYRISNRLAGSVYRIALNDQLPEELKEWLKTIEFAHIKLQHYAKHQNLDFKFSAPKIRAVYEKLKPLFDDPVQDVDNMYDIFEDYIFKMLRDWECLTKYFTEDEVRYLDTLYPEECIIDGKPVYHMLPQDVGYPPGLTANEYLLLILQNPEEWFMNQAQAQAQANQRNRQQNNGTQGGCNTNQDGSSSGGQPDEADMNHNKEEKDKPQRKQKNNQQNQNGQQNQQQNNQQQNGSQNGQQNQPQQGMGSDQQNQDAAANTQSQDWKDGKNQNENSGSQNQSGSSSNNKDGDTEDRDSQSAGASGGQSKSDDKSESESDGVGGGSSGEEKGSEDKESSNGGSSSKDGNDSDDKNGDSSSSGGSSDRGDSTEDEQTANGGGSEEDGEKSEDGESAASNGSDKSGESGEDLSGDGDESKDGSDSESAAEGDNTDQLGEGGDGQDSGDGEDGENGDVEEPYQPTKEELEEMIKNFVQKIVTDYQKMVETKAEQSAAQNQELQGYSKGGGGGQGTVLADGCSNWVDFEGLEKEIKELLINRSITTSKRDLLYNYNRGRGCGDVLTPRYREETRYEDVPMTVILDVSGSISEKNILGFCNIFKNVSRMVDKKCTIVLWDTGLRAIFDSKDEIKAVSGGGTDIGSGIRYVKDKMQPADVGNLFVVSDCEDTLEDWNVEDFDTAYLVCWSSMDVIQHYTGTKFNEFCGQFEKILVKS